VLGKIADNRFLPIRRAEDLVGSVSSADKRSFLASSEGVGSGE
jgi:hypothetical protein